MGNLKLTSPNCFANGGPIPRKYGYKQENVSPPLKIEGIPDEAKSLTLIMEDPDAEKCGFSRPYIHWVAYNILPATPNHSFYRIPEANPGVTPITKVARDKMTKEERTKRFNEYIKKSYHDESQHYTRNFHPMLAVNDFGEFAYGGPAPPSGIDFPVRHKYFFRLFALRIGSYQEYAQIPKPGFGEQQAKKDKGRTLLLTAESVKMAIKKHIIEEATLTGTYQTDEEFAKTNSSPKS